MYPPNWQKSYILSNYRAITLQPRTWQITRPISVETSIPQKPAAAKPFPWGIKHYQSGGRVDREEGRVRNWVRQGQGGSDK